MKIYVDADGCPVVDIVIDIGKKYDLDVIVVKNHAHKIVDDYAQIVSVDISNDSADFYIVNRVEKRDIVVTQDYGLAAMCLSKEAVPINQNGLIYSNNNIEGMLNSRHIHKTLRRQGIHHSKAKKRKSHTDIVFKDKLEELINSMQI